MVWDTIYAIQFDIEDIFVFLMQFISVLRQERQNTVFAK